MKTFVFINVSFYLDSSAIGEGECEKCSNLRSILFFCQLQLFHHQHPHQASVTAEMWEEFKFAINPFAGDTKPNPAVTAEQNALSRASSKMMSKVLCHLIPRKYYNCESNRLNPHCKPFQLVQLDNDMDFNIEQNEKLRGTVEG